MLAEIITIGDELLIGQVVDTNSTWMARELNKIGVEVLQVSSIKDSEDHIVRALNEAFKRVDLVITTGGLGPTKDDITKHTLTHYCKDHLEFRLEVLQHIEELFASYGKAVSEVNRQQAYLPSRCTGLYNRFGTAQGMWMPVRDKVVVSLPGVPYEMKAIFQDGLLDRIQDTFHTPEIMHKTILTTGIGESWLADEISEWEEQLPRELKLAYLPSPGRVRLRLSLKGTNREEMSRIIQEQVDALMPLIAPYFYGFEEEHLEQVVGKLLTDKGLTLSTAESCTGGSIAATLTSVPGSSAYFKGSVVSYATEVKRNVLSVKQATIDQHSVVSEEVAVEMALGVRDLLQTDYAISATGVAGPQKGEDGRDVGTVCIGLVGPEFSRSWTGKMGKNREQIINKAKMQALEYLRKSLIE